MEKTFFVYILASRKNGTLYIGVASDLEGGVWDHKQKTYPGFTSKYGVDKLVWYEDYPTADEAIDREKDLKKWRRAWKIRLIEEMNPDWRDLYETLAWCCDLKSRLIPGLAKREPGTHSAVSRISWVPGSRLRRAPE